VPGALPRAEPADGGTARAVIVEEAGEADGMVVVRGDLSITQSVILDAVEAGDRVRGEER